MTMVSEKTASIWMAGEPGLKRPALSESLHTEIVIIGAGIAGLSVAYSLSRAGYPVVVIDDGDIGGGNTSRTTAHLSNALDDRFSKLTRERGVDVARVAAASHGAAIDFIEDVQKREKIDCGFQRVDGYLILGDGDKENILDDELKAAHAAGLTDVEKLPHPPSGIPSVPCLRFPRQARFEPMAYQRGLAAAIEKSGGRIFCGSHVVAVEDGTPVKVETAGGHHVTADYAIVATATPINDRVKLHTKLAPYRSYAMAARIDKGVLPDALIWDTQDPYHYIRLAEHGGETFVILGGEDHKTGQGAGEIEAMQRLEDWARSHFRIGDIAFRWSGQVMETIDGLGLIGRNPGDKNVYVVAGDSGMGITHGTIAAILIPALIAAGTHPWETAYDPGRKPIGTAATFVAENLNVAAQFADFVTPGDVKSVDDIASGEGAVVRHGLSKIAAFRDENGVLHVRSAVCPHLGCIVHWNRLEQVFDCPCHGSQFSPTGQVLHGPAVRALAAVDDFNDQNNPNMPEAAE